MSDQPTLRALMNEAWPDIETILELSEDERVRLACFRLEKRFIDALNLLDEAETTFARTPSVSNDGVAHRLIPDPLSCPEVPAETRNGETT